MYKDATANKIGKLPNLATFLNLSAGAWALLTLILGTFVFPLYLYNRSKLIAKASQYPITTNHAGIKLSLLTALCALFLSMLIYVALLPVLPKCDDIATQEYLAKSFNKWHKNKDSAERYGSLTTMKQVDYNDIKQTRSCTATLITTQGQDPIHYSIDWLGDKNDLFVVNFRYVKH